jgi:hypothetical protein
VKPKEVRELMSIAKFFTADEAARILGVDRERVYDLTRRGHVKPALTKGAHQYDRRGLVRMAVFLAIQEAVGPQAAGLPPLVAGSLDDSALAQLEEAAFSGKLHDAEITLQFGRPITFRFALDKINLDEVRKVPA